MNLERMQALIRATEEANDETFDMKTVTHPCGAPACVLGNYAAREDLQQAFILNVYGVLRSAKGFYVSLDDDSVCEHFDITAEDAADLFESVGCDNAGCDKQKALAYLRAFVAARTP